jgi:hypothetical protein
MVSERGSGKAMFSKKTDIEVKAVWLGLTEKDEAMEAFEMNRLIGNLINTPECNNFRSLPIAYYKGV